MQNFSVPRTARPFLVLAVALVAQSSAGMIYLWSALTPGLKHNLYLTNAQSTSLVAVANSGTVLGILGGIFHSHTGSRITTATGLLGIALCYASLAGLITISPSPESNASVFTFCMVVAFSTVVFAIMVYGASLTAAASLFPHVFRGRVVGLCAAMFGGAAGIAGSIQAGFFPSLQDTRACLIFLSVFALFPGFLSLVLFPDKETFQVDPSTHHFQSYGSSCTTQNSSAASPAHDITLQGIPDHVEPRLRHAYHIAWILVGCIQGSAVVGVLDLSNFWQRLCAIAVISVLCSYAILPLSSSLTVEAETMSASQELQNSEPLPSWVSVTTDIRFLYLCLGFLVVVGGGGICLLVQAPTIISRILYVGQDALTAQYDAELVNRMVRVIVVIFSTCNVTARLGLGAIMDWGHSASERLLWKCDILVSTSFFMGVALLAIAFVQSSEIYIAAAMIGLCFGTWYSTCPALITLWFGVRSFPRNFALLSPLIAVSSLTLASWFPNIMRSTLGEWVDLNVVGGAAGEVERVCNSSSCSVPLFGLLSLLQFIVFILGLKMRTTVQEKGEVQGF